MRTIKENIYEFSELSKDSQEIARNWYRSTLDNDWHDDVINYAENIAKILGFSDFKINYSGFSSQGDGASFTGFYKYAKLVPKNILSYGQVDPELLRIAKGIQSIQKKCFYQLTVKISHYGNYFHENSMSYDYERKDGVFSEFDNGEQDINFFFRDFAKWIYRQLENEYDYQTTDECIDRNIALNAYEFYENGRIL